MSSCVLQICAALLCALSARVAQSLDIPPPPPGARFTTALCGTPEGDLWLGTEGSGLFHFEAQSGKWNQITRHSTGGAPEPRGATFSTAELDILGDNRIYALARDRQGRIWAGHLNHGVSVWNGKAWRNYDALSGPLGERVFDIKICPLDGSVWMATSRGLARYRANTDQWEYFVAGNGKNKSIAGIHPILPTNLTDCLDFARNGTLFIGTRNKGLVVLSPIKKKDGLEYRLERQVICAMTRHDQIKPLGRGLPSDQIHAVLVHSDGTLYVATHRGLAFSNNQGATFSFVRGEDWDDKAGGWLKPVPRKILAAAAKRHPVQLTLEDDIRCLAEDEAGNLWLGHWSAGAEVLDGKTGRRISQTKDAARLHDFANAFCAVPGGMIVGWHGGGMTQETVAEKNKKDGGEKAPQARTPAQTTTATSETPFPAPAAPATAAELRAYAAALSKPTKAQFLDEDWTTAGDWIGRYGRQSAMLCAAAAPENHPCGLSWDYFTISGSIGPHFRDGEGLRHWLHAFEFPGPNALWDPWVGLHREAEWDDHGETYPRTFEGPDVEANIDIKAKGSFRVSAYFFNPNGHDGSARFRDYLVELRPWPVGKKFPAPPRLLTENPDTWPLLDSTRVRDFAGGGVWEKFIVPGPGRYMIRVRRNGSFNAILNGVFIDRLEGEDTGAIDGPQLACMGGNTFDPEPFMDAISRQYPTIKWHVTPAVPQTPSRDGAPWPPPVPPQRMGPLDVDPVLQVLTLRALPSNAPLRWRVGLWTSEDRIIFRKAVDEGYQAFAQLCSEMNDGRIPRRH